MKETKTDALTGSSKAGQKGYRMKAKARELHPNATTLVGSTPVALSGDRYEVEIPGDRNNPPTRKAVRGATQAELKALFQQGHPDIEEFEL